jgi:dynein heavy chain
MTGEVTYGGRVTDEWDRVILNNLLEKYYSTKTLDSTKEHKFSRSDAYFIPFDCS